MEYTTAELNTIAKDVLDTIVDNGRVQKSETEDTLNECSLRIEAMQEAQIERGYSDDVTHFILSYCSNHAEHDHSA